MSGLLHDLIIHAAERFPDNEAVIQKGDSLSYAELTDKVTRIAAGFVEAGLRRGDRVAVYLSKRFEAVSAIFGTTMAGGVFVPVNPLLKSEQLVHILQDCNVKILVTTKEQFLQSRSAISGCADLQSVVVVDAEKDVEERFGSLAVVPWELLQSSGGRAPVAGTIDFDMAAIFYTSGSTGKPKGVVLSHQNMVVGAQSVSHYLRNQPTDRLLSVLPLSFDYGFSQLSTACQIGATLVLIDYLFPKDVLDAAEKYAITGLAGVPPLWIQLAKLDWPEAVVKNLRYITNSGGVMPRLTLDRLRACLPETEVFLMYGLTEAFRSTYLPPGELDRRPDSMGKAIPNAEVLVLREDGSLCDSGEPGELVHRGALVAQGYWNDPERTAKRFRTLPGQVAGLVLPEVAVWSGDTVKRDEEGFLYFIGRRDDMIKTSGYRVSPAEIESVVYAIEIVAEAVAIGIAHPVIGQGIVVVAAAASDHDADTDMILAECRRRLPNYMVPDQVIWKSSLPRNPNGKIDRQHIQDEFSDLFQERLL